MPDCSGAEEKTQNLANDEDMGYKEGGKEIKDSQITIGEMSYIPMSGVKLIAMTKKQSK